MYILCAVEPLIKDTPSKGHNRKKHFYKRTHFEVQMLYSVLYLLERDGNLSVKGTVPDLNSEVPLYCVMPSPLYCYGVCNAM